MSQHTLFVCSLCHFSKIEKEQDGLRGGQHLINALKAELKSESNSLQIQPVQCMGACDRSCVVTFMAANKYTFVFSDLSPLEAAPELLEFSRQYLNHPTGAVPYQERSESIKKKLFLIIPPANLA